MISLKKLIIEAGQDAGKLELVKTTPETAEAHATKEFQKSGRSIEDEMPNFLSNYKIAQQKAGTGKTQRKDMPVVDDKDVKDFQLRLSKGYIDVSAPFATTVKGSDPFPQGLSGERAKTWLQNGLPSHDGAKQSDDKVKISDTTTKVGSLKPIQKQIYFDKSIAKVAKFGVSDSLSFMKTTSFIVSKDNYIIDGHHRFLTAMLIDPNMKVHTLKVDLPISKLLPATLAYGDAVGNKRNA